MSRVDWRGLALAIGQIDKLIEPSEATKREMDFEDWKEKSLWNYGLSELTRMQGDIEEKEQKYADEYNKAFTTNASLVKNMDSKWDTGNAFDMHKLLSSNSMDAIYKRMGQLQTEAAELTGAIETISVKNRSVELGKNMAIPVSYGDMNKEAWDRGQPLLNEEGEITGYTSWDTNNDKMISGNEAARAIPIIVNMMAESGAAVDEQGVKSGYWSQFNDEARAEKELKVERANKSYRQGIIDDAIAKGRDDIKWADYLLTQEYTKGVTRAMAALKYAEAVKTQASDITNLTNDQLIDYITTYEYQAKTNQRFNLDDPIFKNEYGEDINETEYQQRLANLKELNKGKSKYIAEALKRNIDLFSAQDFQEVYHNNYYDFHTLWTAEDEWIELEKGTSFGWGAGGTRGSTLLIDEVEWDNIQEDQIRSAALSSILNDMPTTGVDDFNDKLELIKVPDASPEIVNGWNEDQKKFYISLMEDFQGITPTEISSAKDLLGL